MARPLSNDAGEGPRGRAATSLNHPQHSTRSWTHDGIHYTVHSTSYATPGLSFGSSSGTANGPFNFDPFMSSHRGHASRATPFGLLGSAFGLLENTLAMHPQHTIVGDHGFGQGSRRQVEIDTPNDNYDCDLAYEGHNLTPNRRARPKSIFSRLKDRLVDAKQHHREDSSSSRERSFEEDRSRRSSRRHSVYPAETRPPAREATKERPPEFIEVDYHDETDSEPEYTHSRGRTSSEQRSAADATMIESLEDAVELEERNVRGCKQKLANASKQANINSAYLQRIIDELKEHERRLAMAMNDLDEAKARRIRNKRPELPTRPLSYRRSEMPPREKSQEPPRSRPRQSQSTRNMREQFFDPFGGFPGHPPHADPVMQAFQNLHGLHAEHAMQFDPFNHFFEQSRPFAEDAHFRFFATPGDGFQQGAVPQGQKKRTRHSTGGAQPNVQHTYAPAGTANFTRPLRRTPVAPQPPATVLRSDEAKRLFAAYDEKWKSLPSTNPDIPYPARGLHAGGLAARESLWAPHISTHVGSWSEETVMQANAQAFFLGVVGLSPMYTQHPATGRVEVGFDKSQATAQQIQQLVDILKKEKIRWHSDRLGRRNGGRSGPNEALQKDERARAVFHAVCELMERAQ